MALTFCGLCISIGLVSPTKPQFGSRHHFHTIPLHSIIYKQAPACLRVGLDHPWDCAVPFPNIPISQPLRRWAVASPAVPLASAGYSQPCSSARQCSLAGSAPPQRVPGDASERLRNYDSAERMESGENEAPKIIWGGRWDLNPRRSEPQSDALPAELRPPLALMVARRHPAENARCRTAPAPANQW